MKGKNIDWTLGLLCDHNWGHDLINLEFIGHIEHLQYVSAKNGPIATKWKMNISIEL